MNQLRYSKPVKRFLHGKQDFYTQCLVWRGDCLCGVLYFNPHSQKWVLRVNFADIHNTNKRNLAQAKIALETAIVGLLEG